LSTYFPITLSTPCFSHPALFDPSSNILLAAPIMKKLTTDYLLTLPLAYIAPSNRIMSSELVNMVENDRGLISGATPSSS
jgi:hypothetical protein